MGAIDSLIISFHPTVALTVVAVVVSRRFTGIEFTVVHAQPPTLFIIHKRERLSPDDSRSNRHDAARYDRF